MAVTPVPYDQQIVLKLSKGTATIRDVVKTATIDQAYALGQAFGTLQQEIVEHVQLVKYSKVSA